METKNRYSGNFKRKVLKSVLEKNLSVREISRRYGIKGNSTISQWMKNNEAMKTKPMKLATGNAKPVQTQQELELEIQYLNKELAKERLFNRALNVMIDIAEARFKIPIRKKPGARQ